MKLSLNLLAKAPRIGEVKTRLIPSLGAEGAAWAQSRLLETMLELTQGWCQNHPPHLLRVWLDVEETFPFFKGRGLEGEWRRQPSLPLGERLIHVCGQAMLEADGVILVGGDGVSLTASHLTTVVSLLMQLDAVMIPALDGGYVLLAMRRFDASLFQDIPWGTDQVAAVTRSKLNALGYNWKELPPLWDVDRPEDWQRFCVTTKLTLPQVTATHGVVCQDTFCGPVWLLAEEFGLTRLSWYPASSSSSSAPEWLYQASQWLSDYGHGRLSPLSVPLTPEGTSFQQRVWLALMKIPPGLFLTYGRMAEKLGTGARAVGNAVARNPLPIFIPCHRVTGSNGLGGYSGWGGIESKKRLLSTELEAVKIE